MYKTYALTPLWRIVLNSPKGWHIWCHLTLAMPSSIFLYAIPCGLQEMQTLPYFFSLLACFLTLILHFSNSTELRNSPVYSRTVILKLKGLSPHGNTWNHGDTERFSIDVFTQRVSGNSFPDPQLLDMIFARTDMLKNEPAVTTFSLPIYQW